MANPRLPRTLTQPAPLEPMPPQAVIAAKLQKAFDHHQRGQLAPAEALYREVLGAMPLHEHALHMLGMVQFQKGKYDAAIELIRKSIEIAPAQAVAYSNLALALQQLKKFEEALASCDRSLAIKHDSPEALNNRGNALHELQRFQDALDSYDRAVALRPGFAEAFENRGVTLAKLGRYDAALASHEQALALRPGWVEALNNCGNALCGMKRYEDALASYDRALALRPDHADALMNRGDVLRLLGQHARALAAYDRVVALQPDRAEAHLRRGNVLLELMRETQALASYDRALAVEPDFVEALISRGIALRRLGRLEEAIASYDRALNLEPGSALALYNRGNAQLESGRPHDASRSFARLLELVPDHPFAKGQLLHAEMLCCDWTHFASMTESIGREIEGGKKVAEPFGYLGVSSSEKALRLCATTYAATHFPRAPTACWKGEKYDNPRIRIGYLSGEFRHQATSILMTELFELHDRKRFELFAFDNGWDDGSAIRRRIERAFDEVVDIAHLGDSEAANAIRARRIDILVNLNGYFGRDRQGVFSRRPCPVQVNYLGFPGTLGADYIDYIVADRHVIPPGHDAFYVERVVRLPDTYQVNDSKRRIAERTPSRTEADLPDAGFVFCCFNNHYKITPDIFDVWMRLLGRVEGSVMWILEGNAAAMRNLRSEAQKRGVASERLVFAPFRDLAEHLARHRLADLFLDTLPYNAHTTASDALWAGLPLVTCSGSTFPGRVAASLLEAAGLPELITHSRDDYEALALRLATTPVELAAVRAKLARNRTSCPLFDTERFRRHIESAYVTMWARYQRGEPPAAFSVEPIG